MDENKFDLFFLHDNVNLFYLIVPYLLNRKSFVV